MLPEFLSFTSAAAKLVQLCLFAMSNRHKASDADLDQEGAEKNITPIVQMDFPCFIVILTGCRLGTVQFDALPRRGGCFIVSANPAAPARVLHCCRVHGGVHGGNLARVSVDYLPRGALRY